MKCYDTICGDGRIDKLQYTVIESLIWPVGNVEVTSSILVSSFFIENNIFQIDAKWASVFFYVERDVELTRSF